MIRGEQNQRRSFLQLDFRADDELDFKALRGLEGAHDPCKGAAIGKGKGLVSQSMRTFDQFGGLRCTALKGKGTQAMQFGIGGQL